MWVKHASHHILRHAATCVANQQIDDPQRFVLREPENQTAASAHRLSAIHEQINEDLLELTGVGRYPWNGTKLTLHLHAVFHQLPFEQHKHIFQQEFEIGRFKAARAGPRHVENAGRDLCRPSAGRKNAFQRLVSRGLIAVAQAHPRVVENGGQGIVKLVRCGAEQFAKAGCLLGV